MEETTTASGSSPESEGSDDPCPTGRHMPGPIVRRSRGREQRLPNSAGHCGTTWLPRRVWRHKSSEHSAARPLRGYGTLIFKPRRLEPPRRRPALRQFGRGCGFGVCARLISELS